MRALFACLLAALVLGLQLTAAAAHPEVLRTDPPTGGIVETAPRLLTITFTEPVESRLLDVSVVSEAGSRVDGGDARRLDDARQVQVGLGALGQGGYLVRWRALGFDGHIVAGAFNFGVGRAPSMQATTPERTPLSETVTRWVTLLAACLLVGGVLFRQLVLAPAARLNPSVALVAPHIEERLLSLIWAGFSIFLGASVVLLATQTMAAGREAGLSRLGDVLLGSRFGQLWIARMALLSALGVALAHFETPEAPDGAAKTPRTPRRKAGRAGSRGAGADVRAMAFMPLGIWLPFISALVAESPRPPTGVGSGSSGGTDGAIGLAEIDQSREQWWWIAAALGIALLFLFSLGGHPAVTEVALLAVPLDWIHRVAGVAWIGGTLYLGMLWLKGYASREVLMALLRRFSAVAVASVAILIPTGLFAAWVYIPSPAETTDSPYGAVLLVKLALVAGMAGLGLLHWRTALLPDRTPPRLGRTLATEALLGAAVLAAVALLVNLAPAQGQSEVRRAAASAPTDPQSTSSVALTLASDAGPNLVTLTVDPPRPGNVRLRIDLIDDVGRPVDDATVIVRATQAGSTSGDSTLTATRQGTGRYATEWAPGPGRWSLHVGVARPAQAEVAAVFNVDLPVAGARDILRRSDQVMNQLQSLAEHQVLEGAGISLDVSYTYVAPDRMRVTETGGIEIVAALGQRYERRGDEWQIEPWPDPRGFRWPVYSFAQLSSDVRLIGIEEIDGRPHFAVAFVDGQGARYTLWIDTETYRVTRQRMLAPGHYMTATFSDFNAPASVEPPDVGF